MSLANAAISSETAESFCVHKFDMKSLFKDAVRLTKIIIWSFFLSDLANKRVILPSSKALPHLLACTDNIMADMGGLFCLKSIQMTPTHFAEASGMEA